MDNKIILEMKNITKAFKGVTVLENASFELREGEIHTLLGENGAGKSTVLNIMSGSLPKDSGTIFLDGREAAIYSPNQAKRLGVIKVHQELQVVPEMTVYENVFLGNELMNPRNRCLWRKKMRARTNDLLHELDADFDSGVPVKELSIAQQQLVEIAKALLNDFNVLILDEPTSSLTKREIKKLFEIMRNLKQKGKAIIFVSHRLEEVFEISDRITVYRDGKYIDTLIGETATRPNLIKLMTGRDLSQGIKNRAEIPADCEVVLSVKGLCSADNRFEDISFDLHKGEILGFAGLVGAGRTETMRAIFGADRRRSGEIFIHGKKVDIKSPRQAKALGMALIPEDRKGQGLIPILPNMNNVGICSYESLTTLGMLHDGAIRENAKKYMAAVNVRPMDPQLNTENLSGGNQQKVVIAKWLSVNANIIIMDEPTRGIDVGAKDEIYHLMLELVKSGVSIIMISSDLPEVLSMSNRVIVMHEGRITGELKQAEASEDKVLNYAMGGK